MKMKLIDKTKQEKGRSPKTYSVEQMKKRTGLYRQPTLNDDSTIVIVTEPNSKNERVILIYDCGHLIKPFSGWREEGYVEIKDKKFSLEIEV